MEEISDVTIVENMTSSTEQQNDFSLDNMLSTIKKIGEESEDIWLKVFEKYEKSPDTHILVVSKFLSLGLPEPPSGWIEFSLDIPVNQIIFINRKLIDYKPKFLGIANEVNQILNNNKDI